MKVTLFALQVVSLFAPLPLPRLAELGELLPSLTPRLSPELWTSCAHRCKATPPPRLGRARRVGETVDGRSAPGAVRHPGARVVGQGAAAQGRGQHSPEAQRAVPRGVCWHEGVCLGMCRVRRYVQGTRKCVFGGEDLAGLSSQEVHNMHLVKFLVNAFKCISLAVCHHQRRVLPKPTMGPTFNA
jgi:hypothetical protein